MIVLKICFALLCLFSAPAFANPVKLDSAIAISAGSSEASGSFLSDRYYSGGSAFSSGIPIDMSHVTNPAPEQVYRNSRYGSSFFYTIPGLNPGSEYLVRLHFAETYFSSVGSRIFNVSINGVLALGNFDLVAATGGQGVVIVKEFAATANSSGSVSIAFSGVVDNAMVSGIEIISGYEPHPVPSPTYNLIVSADQPSYTVGSKAVVLLTARNGPTNGEFEFYVSAAFGGVDVPLTKITDSQSYGSTPSLTAGDQTFVAKLFLQNKKAAKALNDAVNFYSAEIARLTQALGTADPSELPAIQAEIARDQGLLAAAQAQLVGIRKPFGQPVGINISVH